MKKILINYYAILMMVLFIFYNIVLINLKIGGLLYQIFMLTFIFLNATLLIRFRKEIKGKSFVIIVYFLLWLFSKNTLQVLLAISNMIILIIIGFMESHVVKVIAIVIAIFVYLFFPVLFFAFLISFGTLNEERERNDIYENTHYYCENHQEAYSYSAGAMDGFHFSIGKHYEILNINDILYITYQEQMKKHNKNMKNK